jgi:hypothetical protein
MGGRIFPFHDPRRPAVARLPVWVRMLKVPYSILFPLVVLFCIVGAFSLNNSALDTLVMTGFEIPGYLTKKLKYEGAQASPQKAGRGRNHLKFF